MDKIEESFPGLEEYIVKVLSKEQLSNFAEKRRQFYAECIEKLKLPNSKPPSLPPRNEGISFPSRTPSISSISNANYDDVIVPVKIPTPTKTKSKNKPNHKPPPEPSMYFEYDSLEGGLGGGDERISPSDNFYEIPNPSGAKPEPSVRGECLENGNYMGLDLNYGSDSDTSYEPMDGDDQPGGNKQKVKKNKSKRASLDVQDGVGIRSFHNVVITGEIYYKMKTQWKKLRWSAITGNRLVGFLKERDTKQTLDVVLNGYDMLYVDRDGKRNHVIRISCPGCETYFIAFETKEKADTWLQHLNAAAGHDADGRSVALTSDSGISVGRGRKGSEVEEILSAAQKRLSLSGNTIRSASPTVKDKANDKSTKHIISTTSTKSFTSCKYESKTDKGSSTNQITVTTTSTSSSGPDDRPGISTSLDYNSRSPSSVDRNSTRASSVDLNSYRMSSSSDLNSTRAPSISSISSSSSSNTNTSSNVVPCSAGRTIDQDKELFKNLTQDQTYLSKVRAQKKTPHEKVRESIAKLKTKLERLKAKRASIRNEKAKAETFLEQRRLEGEFRAVDTEYKRIDNEIANLEKQLGQAPISIAVLQQQKEEEAAADQGPDSGSSSPRAGRSSVLERLKQFEALQRDK